MTIETCGKLTKKIYARQTVHFERETSTLSRQDTQLSYDVTRVDKMGCWMFQSGMTEGRGVEEMECRKGQDPDAKGVEEENGEGVNVPACPSQQEGLESIIMSSTRGLGWSTSQTLRWIWCTVTS